MVAQKPRAWYTATVSIPRPLISSEYHSLRGLSQRLRVLTRVQAKDSGFFFCFSTLSYLALL